MRLHLEVPVSITKEKWLWVCLSPKLTMRVLPRGWSLSGGKLLFSFPLALLHPRLCSEDKSENLT